MTRSELEKEQEALKERLAEVERFLSAGQLAYSLNAVRQLLVDGKPSEALDMCNGPSVRYVLKLHGYEWR